MNPKPSDLTDATRKHRSTGGEIFTLVHDGSENTKMRAFAGKMSTPQIWNVVNCLRSIGPGPPTSH